MDRELRDILLITFLVILGVFAMIFAISIPCSMVKANSYNSLTGANFSWADFMFLDNPPIVVIPDTVKVRVVDE